MIPTDISNASLATYIVTASYALCLFAEWRHHRRNFWILDGIGAREVQPSYTKLYYALAAVVLPLCFFETLLLGKTFDIAAAKSLGLLALPLGLGCKWYAIKSLGAAWCMKEMRVEARVTPLSPERIRVLRILEHIGRFVENLGLVAFIDAWIINFPFICLTYWVSMRIVRQESDFTDERFAEQE
ncbi:MAG: hypothetical protein AB7T49_02460 [Oligoflexales bacterium]